MKRIRVAVFQVDEKYFNVSAMVQKENFEEYATGSDTEIWGYLAAFFSLHL